MIKRPFSTRRGREWKRGATRRSHWGRLGDLALALAILLLAALSVARLDQVATRQIAGAVRITDGDSLTLNGERIRLRGIDAPEYAQQCRLGEHDYPCGERARRVLVEFVHGDAITCQGWERDRYDRLLARCEGRDRDLGQAMVEAGWAISYGDYAGPEAEARRASRGLWAGSFESPSDWRARQQGRAEAPHDRAGLVVNFFRQLLWGRAGS